MTLRDAPDELLVVAKIPPGARHPVDAPQLAVEDPRERDRGGQEGGRGKGPPPLGGRTLARHRGHVCRFGAHRAASLARDNRPRWRAMQPPIRPMSRWSPSHSKKKTAYSPCTASLTVCTVAW